jgi:tRNA 2-thiouridine synthesizing protein B
MSTLHTVNKSPFEKLSLMSCLGHCLPGDAVILIEDAVVGARKGTSVASVLEQSLIRCRIYALTPDLHARGVASDDLVPGIETVDYGGFVDLAAQHTRTQSWL